VDAIAEVVRVFESEKIIHVHNKIDPISDIGILETELVLADLETVEKRLDKLEREARGGKEAAKKLELTKKIKEVLSSGKAARDAGLDKEEFLLVKDLQLLTFKPVIYVFNTIGDDAKIPEKLLSRNHVILDVKAEEEIAEMTEDDKKELGIESEIDKLIREAYRMLGLITFFTTGEDESRAWTIRDGAKAPEAGTAIHTDFRDKFIRASVIFWEELIKAGSYANAREKGLIRLEGKEYTVKDGDVIEFKI
jgi:GTP-binding protein YchF